jgi:cytochrome bd ubiquinol oxidase subunit I
VGDTAARAIYEDQPAKFAAMEYVLETGPNQPEYIGGILDGDEVKFGIEIPDLDSILAGFSTDTVVTGLDQVPDDEEPPSPTLLHLAFDAMVGIGTGLLLLGAWFAIAWWRKRSLPESRWFWRAAAVAGVGAIVALECGWIVTEVGRQPWIVYGLMRTEDAVTDAGGIWISLTVVVLLYAALAAGAAFGLRTLSRRWRREDEGEQGIPYGPPPASEGS